MCQGHIAGTQRYAGHILTVKARTLGHAGQQRLHSSQPAAAQSNHRSWADFYLDVVATDGNAQMLARMAVAYVFPMFMLAVCIIRSVVLFKRGKKVDHEARSTSPLDQTHVWPVLTLDMCTVCSVILINGQS